MNFNKEPIKQWFGFTRRERRSAFSLLLIVILVIVVRYAFPESRIEIEDITTRVTAEEDPVTIQTKDNSLTSVRYSSFASGIGRGGQRAALRKVIPQKSRIDINTADSASLVKLPGIGPVLAVRIIKYRRMLGGFAKIGQLREVYGLPEETFELIKEQVFADSTLVKRININSAGYKELSHIPYFEKYEITTILKYKELKGRINGISDLTDNKLITIEKAMKVGPYLKFEN